VAAYLALRKGEALALRRTDVDLDLDTIAVRRSHRRNTTKGGHPDTLPIPAPLRPFIENQLALSEGSELLFPGADGEQLPEDFDTAGLVRRVLVHAGVVDGFEHICRRCKSRGVPHVERHPDGADRRCPSCNMLLWPKPVPKRGVDFHSLRHTTATLLLRAGVPAHHVQLILRHADIRTTTQTYGHLMLGDHQKR
jgi:integrase